MSADTEALAAAHDVVTGMLGRTVDVVPFLSSGRNSRIFRVRCGGDDFALKQYPSQMDDPRDRLGTEVGALKLMEGVADDVIPRIVAVDRERNYALMTWLEGAALEQVTDADLDQAVAFLSKIHGLRDTKLGRAQPMAAEACLSGAEIERQVEARLARLAELPASEGELHTFLEKTFEPAYHRLVAAAKSQVRAAGLDFAQDVPETCRSLVPSDFGFHNSLRRRDGALAFLDFEYFGWDDPVKLTADVLLHPGWALDPQQQQRFRQGAEGLYSASDPTFSARLAGYYPLFGLRWTLILLNEFIPERWQRRLAAGGTEDWLEVKTRQLGRAKKILSSVNKSTG